MMYILVSIFCSVTVGVLLKLARRYQINIPQAIAWNYFFAIILAATFFKIDLASLALPSSSLHIYLGILLPAIFLVMAISIKQIGIAKTDVAQRLSLFIPVIASYFLFDEQFSALKIVSLALGFAAIALILLKKDAPASSNLIIYPILVFLGFGVIDVLFKKVAQLPDVSYSASLLIVFVLAFLISCAGIGYLVLFKKEKLQLIGIAYGCILGVFNFANIYFYLKAHKSLPNNPSTVFATMNIGVILLGALVGLVIFREKFSRLNVVGLIMALVAVTCITISRIYAF
jgi:drug/metabolite transporter (DMT)-like permease